MAELEIHHHGDEHEADPTGKKVGVQAAILAVLLAIVTISSHRTHTSPSFTSPRLMTSGPYYQATRIKLHNTELGQNLIQIFGTKNDGAGKILADYEKPEDEVTKNRARESGEGPRRG